jgi:hypothetical protein
MTFLYFFILKNKIAFWDLRKFQEPIGLSEFQMNIKKIQFSPSSKNRLTVLCEKAAELDYLKILTIDDNTTVEPVYCKINWGLD